MKKLIFNWRIYVIGVVLSLGIICLFGEPINASNNYNELFIGSKILAFILLAIGARLTSYWEEKGKIDLDIFN